MKTTLTEKQPKAGDSRGGRERFETILNMKLEDLRDCNGKQLPKSFMKTLLKLADLGIIAKEYREPGEAEYKLWKRTNPFSGVSCDIPRVAASLYDWITSYNPIGGTLKRSDWDNARYVFLSCWPDAYYKLVD